jgi:hypothetical protein
MKVDVMPGCSFLIIPTLPLFFSSSISACGKAPRESLTVPFIDYDFKPAGNGSSSSNKETAKLELAQRFNWLDVMLAQNSLAFFYDVDGD